MSIDTAERIESSIMDSEYHKSKSEKKSKSTTHGEKKRKRDNTEEGVKSKTKKHKSSTTTTNESPAFNEQEASPFHLQTSSLYLPLAAVSQKFPLEGICAEHLSPLLLTYYPPFNGVVLSYSNIRLSEKPYGNDGADVLLHNIDEYAVSWAWVTAEFLLFRPVKGALLEGYVNLQNEGHIGMVCWNLFNASIERKRLPPDWIWIDVSEMQNAENAEAGETYAEDGRGYYVDGAGKRLDGTIKFRVKEIESSHDRERGFLSIEGTLLAEEAEAEMGLSEVGEKSKSKGMPGRRLGGARALGATSLGVPIEVDEAEATERKKHRKRC